MTTFGIVCIAIGLLGSSYFQWKVNQNLIGLIEFLQKEIEELQDEIRDAKK